MALSVGIVGLPNVGKSTVFNALTAGKAEAANYPFCTIDPNVGVVPVPDARLKRIEAHIKTQMIGRLPSLTTSNIVVTYLNPPWADNTCTVSSCKAVRVSLTGYEYEAIIPFVPLTLNLPAFTTTLRREHMQSSGNAVCS